MNLLSSKKNLMITMLYPIIASIFIYKNINGITLPFFSLLTALYIIYYMKYSNVNIKKDSYVILFFILLISISSFLTNYSPIIHFNFIVIIILFIITLIHNYVDDEKFDLLNYIFAVKTTIFYPIFHFFKILKWTENEIPNKNNITNDQIETIKRKPSLTNPLMKNIIYGILISITLLLIIFPTLKSSDIVFSKFIDKIISELNIKEIINFLLLIIFLLILSHVLMKYFYIYRNKNYQYDNLKTGSVITGLISLIPITAIYILYSYIQITKLFINANLTYAEYAREGFFQLLFVSFINFVLIIVFSHKIPANKIMKALFTIISVCTLVMTASSTYRMCLYVEHYDLSHLRYFVFFALLIITLSICGIIINIFYKKFNLTKYFLLIFMIFYTLLAFSRPCKIIAKYNISHSNILTFDNDYLENYSSDAAEIIYNYYKENKEYIDNSEILTLKYKNYFYAEQIDYNILSFNLSKFEGNKYYKLYSANH